MSEEDFKIIQIKTNKDNRKKDNLLESEYSKYNKVWKVTDLFIQLKDWCDDKCVDLLDRCDASELMDLVFGLDSDSFQDDSE